MMKQTRIIRISFLICTICMVAAFWSGFYFGESQLKADTGTCADRILPGHGQ